MKRSGLQVTALAALVHLGGAAAQDIQPRYAESVKPYYAEPVKPRNAEPVRPRYAEPVQPRGAQDVQPYEAPRAANTAVRGSRVSEWHWQKLDNSGLGAGLGRNTQLTDIRCAGLACRLEQSSGGGWTIKGEGGFPDVAASWLDIRLINLATRQAQVEPRRRGVFSDGNFWDIVDTYKLPAGDYAVFYEVSGQSRVVAAILFTMRRDAQAEKAERTGRANAPSGAPANAQAIQKAQQNALCLGAAAMNPDVRCVPGGY